LIGNQSIHHSPFSIHHSPFFVKTRYLFSAVLGGALGVAIASWITYSYFEEEEAPLCRTWSEIQASDTLRVVTVPSSISMFHNKGNWRGYEYEILHQVAAELGLNYQIILAPSEQAMLDSLYAGVADLGAWPTFFGVIREKGGMRPCGYSYDLGLVPIARKEVDFSAEEEEKYRLVVAEKSRQTQALDDELVQTNNHLLPYSIQTLPDTVMPETLVEMVVNGDYDVTLVRSNLAQLLHTYYPELKVGRQLIYSEDSVAWVVPALADTLAMKIDSVCHYDRNVPHYPTLAKRYYEQSLGRQVKIRYLLGNGRLSVYDQLFRNYSKRLGWDWRLLASVSFVESRFDPHEISSKGARGLMQLMPSTATRFGCPAGLITDPEANVRAGASLIELLENSLRSRLTRTIEPEAEGYSQASDSTRAQIERDLIYFTLASYNAGLGHVFDAIALADTLGYEPAVWADNVEQCMRLKVEEEYYTMPCVKHGRFNTRATIAYISEVLETYEDFCRIAK